MPDFIDTVWDFYARQGRDLPWRQAEPDGSFDPYKILVSEIMLQQTQVNRVIPKYRQFLDTFPTVQALASANLGDVLRQWSGLGYNRRAKFLWQAASQVAADWGGVFRQNQKDLTSLPGVGVNTAGAICAYAFNQPVVFIETNIRTVFIYHFFSHRDDVHDHEILARLQACLQPQAGGQQYIEPSLIREWYWALMDYGSHLKTTVGNLSRGSRHYVKQSRFEGSKRQLRGQVLRLLGQSELTAKQLAGQISDQRLPEVLTDLAAEGLIVRTRAGYRLA